MTKNETTQNTSLDNQIEPSEVSQDEIPQASSEKRPVSSDLEQQTSASLKKQSLFKFLIILFVLIGLGSASIFAYFQYKNITSKKEQPKTTSEQKLSSVGKDNLTIVFVESPRDRELFKKNTDKVVFYDIKNQVRLVDIVDFSKPGFLYTLGSWSPNGRYLPIHVTALEDKETGVDSGEISLYIYDSKQHIAKKIYTGNRSEGYENTIIYSQVGIGSGWLDEEKFGYQHNRDLEKNEVTIKYITHDGVRGKTTVTDKFKLKNNALTIKYSNISPEGGTREIQKIYFKGQEIDAKPEGEIIGASDDYIISLKKSKLEYDLGSYLRGEPDPKLEAEYKKIESSDLSEEEKSQKLLELLEPKGSSTIYLTNINTGEVERTISLSEKGWVVQSIQVHPRQPFLLVHETDLDFLPKKHRILKISLINPENKEVLVSEDIISGSSFAGSLLEEGVSFHITAGGNWIIYYEDKSREPFDRNIVMLSLLTKEKKYVCSTYCQWYKVYNPTQLISGY